jgi:hypothetical protein
LLIHAQFTAQQTGRLQNTNATQLQQQQAALLNSVANSSPRIPQQQHGHPQMMSVNPESVLSPHMNPNGLSSPSLLPQQHIQQQQQQAHHQNNQSSYPQHASPGFLVAQSPVASPSAIPDMSSSSGQQQQALSVQQQQFHQIQQQQSAALMLSSHAIANESIKSSSLDRAAPSSTTATIGNTMIFSHPTVATADDSNPSVVGNTTDMNGMQVVEGILHTIIDTLSQGRFPHSL